MEKYLAGEEERDVCVCGLVCSFPLSTISVPPHDHFLKYEIKLVCLFHPLKNTSNDLVTALFFRAHGRAEDLSGCRLEDPEGLIRIRIVWVKSLRLRLG